MGDHSHSKQTDEVKDWKKIKEEAVESIEDAVDDDKTLEHPSYEALEERLTLAEQKAHENWDKSVRALAELENVRRRAERDVANAHRYGLEKLAHELLPVIDGLEQALQAVPESSEASIRDGIELTLKMFVNVLAKFNIKQLNPEGQPFNPQEHEAMSILETPDVASNVVLTVFQKGYVLHDRVIRPARVVVAK